MCCGMWLISCVNIYMWKAPIATRYIRLSSVFFKAYLRYTFSDLNAYRSHLEKGARLVSRVWTELLLCFNISIVLYF